MHGIPFDPGFVIPTQDDDPLGTPPWLNFVLDSNNFRQTVIKLPLRVKQLRACGHNLRTKVTHTTSADSIATADLKLHSMPRSFKMYTPQAGGNIKHSSIVFIRGSDIILDYQSTEENNGNGYFMQKSRKCLLVKMYLPYKPVRGCGKAFLGVLEMPQTKA